MANKPKDTIWSDKKRYFGLPISFTDYCLTPNRIFCETGIFSRHQDQVMLYRVKDFELHRTFLQRMLGVGDVKVLSTDVSSPVLILENVRNPRAVHELVYNCSQAAMKKRNIRATEMLGSTPDDSDGGHAEN